MDDQMTGPLIFTEQHYAALGKVTVAFQSLESTITYGLITFLEPEKLVPESLFAKVVVNEHSFTNRLKLLLVFPSLLDASEMFPENGELSNVHLDTYEETINLLIEGGQLATEGAAKRNQLVHSTWIHGPSVGGPHGTVLRLKSGVKKNKAYGSSEYISASEIEAVAEMLDMAQSKLFKAIQTLHYLLRSASKP